MSGSIDDSRPTRHSTVPPPTGTETVLLPLLGGEVSGPALETAQAIADGDDAELVILNAVTVPEQTPLTLPEHLQNQHRRATDHAVATVNRRRPTLSVTSGLHVGHRLWHVITDATERYDIDTTVLDPSLHDSGRIPFGRTPLEKILDRSGCSVVVPTSTDDHQPIRSMLVPVAGGPHSTVATEIAGAIANTHDAWVELLHVIPPDNPDHITDVDVLLSNHRAHLPTNDKVDTWALEAPSVADAIIEQTQYYDLTIIGAPRTPRLRRMLFGSTAQTVQTNASSDLITVWR